MQGQENHFECLGLVASVSLDREVLEEKYFELARKWHPDRFVSASESERSRAQRQAAQLNEAYRVLRDPLRRAEYLVFLGGINLDSSDPKRGAPAPSAAFLAQMLDFRDAIEEGELEVQAALDSAEEHLEQCLNAATQALQERNTQAAADSLVQYRYYHRLVQELEAS